MKKMLSLVAVLVLCVSALCQENSQIKKPAIGIHFLFNDFKTATNIRSNSLSSTLINKNFGKIKEMVPGLGLSYWQGVNKQLDFSATVTGSFLSYPIDGGETLGDESFLLEADASIHAKMLPDDYWVVPYLTVGVGLSKYKGYYGAIIPAGAGLQINIFNDTFIMINSQYRIKVTDNTNYHFYYSVGFVGNIGAKK